MAQGPPTRRRRDRHGRGMRGELMPAGTGIEALDRRFGMAPPLPDGRTRSARFLYIVDAAFEQLEQRWAAELAGIDYDVAAVPEEPATPADPLQEPVPLSRTTQASGSGPEATRALIMLYRRPIEARSRDRADLAELVFDILVHALSELLGRTPEEIDPEGHGGFEEP